MALDQAGFRFGINELVESTHGWYAAQNVNPDNLPLDTPILLRFLAQASGGVAHSNIDFTFQYSLNGASWVGITTSSVVVKAVASVAFNTADNTTQRMGGTGTFESSSAGCTETGASGGNACDIASNGNAETECCIQLIAAGLLPRDKLRFRVQQEAADMTTYTKIPEIEMTRPIQLNNFLFIKSVGAGVSTTEKIR